jgi:hypothetical protein
MVIGEVPKEAQGELPGDAAEALPEAEAEEPDAANRNGSNGKPPFSLWQFLKDTKELITIILFFVGGIVWLYAAFATKHYVGSVKCLLGATIERIDNEAQAKQLQTDIVELNVQLRKLDSAGLPAADLISQSETLKQKIEDSKGRKQLADAIVKKASQRVQNGECE